MFGRKEPPKPIEEMSLAEVADLIRSEAEEIDVSKLIAIARRVTDIALFEHGITDEERSVAIRLLPALEDDIRTGLAGAPGGWEAYQEAADYHRGQAVHYGYGSLQWIMDERGTEAAEVIPFIARQDHADLLPAYLEMMEPDVIHSIRGALVGELSRARAQDGEAPIGTLNRLATNGDGALTLLLDGRQLGAIGRAHVDPETAETVLTELGVPT
jgi:hypothetical protein